MYPFYPILCFLIHFHTFISQKFSRVFHTFLGVQSTRQSVKNKIFFSKFHSPAPFPKPNLRMLLSRLQKLCKQTKSVRWCFANIPTCPTKDRVKPICERENCFPFTFCCMLSRLIAALERHL